VRTAGHGLIVAITICAWIAISNHCAFRAVANKTETNHSACPFHSKPAKTPPKSESTECCKILRALAVSGVKQLAPAIADLSPVDFEFSKLAAVGSSKIGFTSVTLNTGPPGRTSFVELIGSVRAHAPPAVA
jgi:hypothetical protein